MIWNRKVPPLKHYTRLKWVVGSALAIYFTVGVSTELLRVGEIYPFASWFLFDKVPSERTEYGLLIHEFDGQVIDPPRLYQEAKGIVPDPDSITAHRVIQRMGRAKVRQQTEELQALVRLLEGSFLQAPARYELVRLRYRPLERWRTGEFEMEQLGPAD